MHYSHTIIEFVYYYCFILYRLVYLIQACLLRDHGLLVYVQLSDGFATVIDGVCCLWNVHIAEHYQYFSMI